MDPHCLDQAAEDRTQKGAQVCGVVGPGRGPVWHRSVSAAMVPMAAGIGSVALFGASTGWADLMPSFIAIGIGGGLTIPLTATVLAAMETDQAGVGGFQCEPEALGAAWNHRHRCDPAGSPDRRRAHRGRSGGGVSQWLPPRTGGRGAARFRGRRCRVVCVAPGRGGRRRGRASGTQRGARTHLTAASWPIWSVRQTPGRLETRRGVFPRRGVVITGAVRGAPVPRALFADDRQGGRDLR